MQTGADRCVLPLTAGSAASRAPAWSPDGARIAFESDRDGNWQLYIHDLGRGSDVRLTTGVEDDRQPSWSPDGRSIVFVRGSGDGGDLHSIDVETGETRRLARLPGTELFPAWSPDGTEIAFTREAAGVFDIARLRIGDTIARALPMPPGRDLWPRWSPTGDRIAFFSRRDTAGEDDEIHVLDVRSGRQRRVTTRPGHDFTPAWHPAGDRLVTVSIEPGGDRALRIIDMTGRELGRLASGYFRVTEPTWSPDGERIGFAAAVREGAAYQVFAQTLDCR